MKHLHTFESFSKPERVNEDYRNTDPSLKEYVGKTVKAILEDDDGENSYVTIQFNDNTQMKITAYPLGSGGVGLVLESLNEKIAYPEGGTSSGDKIIDKLAKLLNSSSAKIEVTNNQVRGVNVSFGFAPESTFFVKANDDHYLMNTNKGFYRVDKKDIAKAEDLYDELESIIQAGKTKRPSSRETDMFGKK